jgi:hypothetical protein
VKYGVVGEGKGGAGESGNAEEESTHSITPPPAAKLAREVGAAFGCARSAARAAWSCATCSCRAATTSVAAEEVGGAALGALGVLVVALADIAARDSQFAAGAATKRTRFSWWYGRFDFVINFELASESYVLCK